MDSHNSMKINKVLQAWPKGTVAVHAWLKAQGVSRKLAEQYRRRGWIDAVGRGAFIRRGDNVEWPGAVYAIQTASGKRIHPGGRAALELHGLAHFLGLSVRAPVYLYGEPGARLPAWFRAHDWQHPIRYSATGLFSNDLGLTPRSFGDFAVDISSPERAVLEYLDGFPEDGSFEEAREIVEGLTTLRPEVLQSLLETCTSVKVKRMFLYLADQAKHPWRAELKDQRIELGSGKRSLVREGKFDARYQITVPSDPVESGA
jgi:Transcriptional regulator, AbiEi antitoxin, Type IV TA system/Transcriptional regulator, AbiEi antitoxin N-terminal domain